MEIPVLSTFPILWSERLPHNFISSISMKRSGHVFFSIIICNCHSHVLNRSGRITRNLCIITIRIREMTGKIFPSCLCSSYFNLFNIIACIWNFFAGLYCKIVPIWMFETANFINQYIASFSNWRGSLTPLRQKIVLSINAIQNISAVNSL